MEPATPHRYFKGIHAVFSRGGLYPLFQAGDSGQTKLGAGGWIVISAGIALAGLLVALVITLG